jgi:hypothetical protein
MGHAPRSKRGNQMLLRRVIAHLRKQEWTAIAIDFVIVVAGVFVGIQVSNWNAARIERTQEREFIVRLHEDFEESVAGQTRDLDFLAQQLSDQAVILASLDNCVVAPENAMAFQRGVQTLGYINPPRLYRRTIDEMAAAGKTDIVQNETIKARLAEIVALVEWRAAAFNLGASEHYRNLIEEQVRYDFNRTFPDRFLGEIVGVDFNIRALCRNPALASAVSAISQATRERQRAYAPILDRYRALLPMLEEEARQRWHVTIAPLPQSSK